MVVAGATPDVVQSWSLPAAIPPSQAANSLRHSRHEVIMFLRAILIALFSLPLASALAATPLRTNAAASMQAVQRIDDYGAATEAARASGAMLLVSVEPHGGASSLDRPGLEERFAASGTPWVFCRPDATVATTLSADASLVEMRGGAGAR